MHKDVKIGLLLGVVMVVVVAVFFFGRSGGQRDRIKKLVPETPNLAKVLDTWKDRHLRGGQWRSGQPEGVPSQPTETAPLPLPAPSDTAQRPVPDPPPVPQGNVPRTSEVDQVPPPRVVVTSVPPAGETAGPGPAESTTPAPESGPASLPAPALIPGPQTADRPPTGVERRHKVAKGESLSVIAKRYYGDGLRFRTIWRANRDRVRDPNQLMPGLVLVIPPKNGGEPVAQAGRQYVVQRNDTLMGIARKLYKDERKYLEIYRANSHILASPHNLKAGTKLVLPDQPVATLAHSERQRR